MTATITERVMYRAGSGINKDGIRYWDYAKQGQPDEIDYREAIEDHLNTMPRVEFLELISDAVEGLIGEHLYTDQTR
jgi:hypothetical protein